jgi:hypothetical protein
MAIEKQKATVYWSSMAGRRYFSKKAAIAAEARGLIEARYPTEQADRDEFGRCTDPGFHWREIDNSETLLRRVCRLVAKNLTL